VSAAHTFVLQKCCSSNFCYFNRVFALP